MLDELSIDTMIGPSNYFRMDQWAIPARASGDASWSAHIAKANGTCIGRPKMVSPEASAPVLFYDAAGKIAILLRKPVVRGKNKTINQLICLYDQKTGRVSIAEDRWLGK